MFTKSQSVSANTKEKLFAQLAAFILEGCQLKDFTPLLKKHLPGMFNTHAFGYVDDPAGFEDHYLHGPKEKLRLLKCIREYTAHTDPAYSVSDVEEELQSWVEANLNDIQAAFAA